MTLSNVCHGETWQETHLVAEDRWVSLCLVVPCCFIFELSMGGGTLVFPVLKASECLNQALTGRRAPRPPRPPSTPPAEVPLRTPVVGRTGNWAPALAQQPAKERRADQSPALPHAGSVFGRAVPANGEGALDLGQDHSVETRQCWQAAL